MSKENNLYYNEVFKNLKSFSIKNEELYHYYMTWKYAVNYIVKFNIKMECLIQLYL